MSKSLWAHGTTQKMCSHVCVHSAPRKYHRKILEVELGPRSVDEKSVRRLVSGDGDGNYSGRATALGHLHTLKNKEHSNGAHRMRLGRGESGTKGLAPTEVQGRSMPVTKVTSELPRVEDTPLTRRGMTLSRADPSGSVSAEGAWRC